MKISHSLDTFIVAALFVLLSGVAGAAEKPISREEATAIGVDAYIYLYPLVTMDVTRRQLTNIEAGMEFGRGPMNMFTSVPVYPPPDFKAVVRPNFDTLYSSAWLDLTKEPVVVSVPDTGGRYYLLPMLDMWTDVFASPGWRTTGTEAVDFLLTPPGWTGAVGGGLTRIDAPTPYVWIIGRTKTDGPSDYDAVHKIQAGYKITPLSRWGASIATPSANIDPSVDMKTPPKEQVDHMGADRFFAYAAELLKVNPPHLTDQPIIARMNRIGMTAGHTFDISELDSAVREALESVPRKAQELMRWKDPKLGTIVDNWQLNSDTMGVYGNYYLKRAIIAQRGLGANLPEDAVYPQNLADADGNSLDGTNNYKIHFDKESLPPVNAFWSITLYDDYGFQVPNAINRFAVSSWMPFRYNADGSLDLYIQNENPGKDTEANWLPAPRGPFNLTMRLYAPKSDVLIGKWNPPEVTNMH